MPAFKRINNPVDAAGTICATRHVLKKLNDSEPQQLIVFIYILNATAIKQNTLSTASCGAMRENNRSNKFSFAFIPSAETERV